MIILGPKTAILGPQFCRILVLGPHFWWSGGAQAPPGSAAEISGSLYLLINIWRQLDWVLKFMELCLHGSFVTPSIGGSRSSCRMGCVTHPDFPTDLKRLFFFWTMSAVRQTLWFNCHLIIFEFLKERTLKFLV